MPTQSNVPRCLYNRYEALDNLVKRLDRNVNTDEGVDKGIQLMCYFWNILKEHPGFDLVTAVRNCVGGVTGGGEKSPNIESEEFILQNITCYRASNERTKKCSKPGKSDSRDSATWGNNNPNPLPLSQILSNLNEVTSADRANNLKIQELLEIQARLQRQINILEEREKTGAALMKQAEDVWTKMENAYKKKIEDIHNRTNIAYKELREIEDSTLKWKKSKRELEEQLANMNKCQDEIKKAINEKKNDMKLIQLEINDYQKRIASTLTDIKNFDNSIKKLQEGHMGRMQKLVYDVQQFTTTLQIERKKKEEKERDAGLFTQDARADLARLQKSLVKSELDNQTLLDTKQELLDEMQILGDSCKGICEKCDLKEDEIDEDLKKVEQAIEEQRIQSLHCSQCVSTAENRKFCTDCPKCLKERRCAIIDDTYCENDPMECICQTVKLRLMENIFENMEIILSKTTKTDAGKKVGDVVLSCLKKSKNGKLDQPTMKILKSFILKNLKTNIMPAIIGGSVKTRCELEPSKYEMLMDCIKKVKVEPIKLDAETITTTSCTHWGGPCHCPKKGKGPCPCAALAPKKLKDAASCPPPDPEDVVATGAKVMCPQFTDQECGPDCGARFANSSSTSQVSGENVVWTPNACMSKVKCCKEGGWTPDGGCKNKDKMKCCKSYHSIKSVQCVLGTNVLKRNLTRTKMNKSILNFPPTSSPASQLEYSKNWISNNILSMDKNVSDQKLETISPSRTSENEYILDDPLKRNKSGQASSTLIDDAIVEIKMNKRSGPMSTSHSSNVLPAEDGSFVVINNRAEVEVPKNGNQPTKTLSEVEKIIQNFSPTASLEIVAAAVQSDLDLKYSHSCHTFDRKQKRRKRRQTFEEKIQMITDEVLSIKDSDMKYFAHPRLNSLDSILNLADERSSKGNNSFQ